MHFDKASFSVQCKEEYLIISSGQGNLLGAFCANGFGMPLEIETGKYCFRQFVHIAVLTYANKCSIIVSLRAKPIAQSRRDIGRIP
jgi:hypothetical protein